MDLNAHTLIDFLKKFKPLEDIGIDLTDKYLKAIAVYQKSIDHIKKNFYNNRFNPKTNPMMPPVAGKIEWARQIFEVISTPIEFFKDNFPLLQSNQDAIKAVNSYNKLAKSLVEYEVLFYDEWVAGSLKVVGLLQNTIFSFNANSGNINVNMDPRVYELIDESKKMHLFGLNVPENLFYLIQQELKFKETEMRLKELLVRCKDAQDRVPVNLRQLLKPATIEMMVSLCPGVKEITWTSMNIEECN